MNNLFDNSGIKFGEAGQSNADFDKMLSLTEKTVKRTFLAVFLIWAFGVLTSLAVSGALIYVAYHFISKYW